MAEWIESITPEQFAKLPVECQDVVNLDRDLHRIRQWPVVPLATFRATRDELRRNQRIVKDNWGNHLKGNTDTE